MEGVSLRPSPKTAAAAARAAQMQRLHQARRAKSVTQQKPVGERELDAAIMQRRAAEQQMGIKTTGTTDPMGRALAPGWVHKVMGDTEWYENEVLDQKSWTPIYA